MIQFKRGTLANYNLIASKDADTLYFITDTNQIFLGADEYTKSVQLVTSWPTTGQIQGKLYVNTTLTPIVGRVWTGSAWQDVIGGSASPSAISVINSLTHTGSAGDALDALQGPVITGLIDEKIDIDGLTPFIGKVQGVATVAGDNALTLTTKGYVDGILAANDALIFKGTLGTGGTITTLPTTGYAIGHTYKVIEAGTYAGKPANVGDLFIATVSVPPGSNANGNWVLVQTNETGTVIGPNTANNNALAAFDGTTGALIKDSGILISSLAEAVLMLTSSKTSGQFLKWNGTNWINATLTVADISDLDPDLADVDLVTVIGTPGLDTAIPTEKAVRTELDKKVDKFTSAAAGNIVTASTGTSTSGVQDSGKAFSTASVTSSSTNNQIPTSLAVHNSIVAALEWGSF